MTSLYSLWEENGKTRISSLNAGYFCRLKKMVVLVGLAGFFSSVAWFRGSTGDSAPTFERWVILLLARPCVRESVTDLMPSTVTFEHSDLEF